MKDDIYWKVLSCAIELDFKKGHLKWTVSDLSRKSKITRSLIYYYFGRSKINILNEAIKLVGEELVGISDHRVALWKEGKYLESLLCARKVSEQIPFLNCFITQHLFAQTPIGQGIRDEVKLFKKKLRRFFPDLTTEEVRGFYSLYWGLVFAPGIQKEDIASVFHLIEDKFNV